MRTVPPGRIMLTPTARGKAPRRCVVRRRPSASSQRAWSMTSSGSLQSPPRLLVTAGPTHEPIDSVRYLANRSSGRLGIAIADEAARRGWRTTMLLGPSSRTSENTSVEVHRFRTTADLQTLLEAHFPHCDILIMAAAVADYRPAGPQPQGKIRRTEQGLSLALEPTPDLLAGLSAGKRSDQLLVGFALEPADRLEESARSKLARKGLDAIVANTLETMDSESIEATVFYSTGDAVWTGGCILKPEFAGWLLDRLGKR